MQQQQGEAKVRTPGGWGDGGDDVHDNHGDMTHKHWPVVLLSCSFSTKRLFIHERPRAVQQTSTTDASTVWFAPPLFLPLPRLLIPIFDFFVLELLPHVCPSLVATRERKRKSKEKGAFILSHNECGEVGATKGGMRVRKGILTWLEGLAIKQAGSLDATPCHCTKAVRGRVQR